ncbi:MAG: TetR/AcrR family transcriptional regulator [Actinomycetota bacterium]
MAKRNPAARDTKERILDAALEVFGEHGYRAASIDEIAARAGATKGAIYYYFTDKDDLARDLRKLLWNRLRDEAVAASDPDGDVVTNLTHTFGAYLTALQRLGAARFFLRDSWALTASEAKRDELESQFPLLRAFLEEGIRRGELLPLDVDAMARALVGAFSEATLHILTTGESGPTTEVVEHIVRSLAAAPRKASKR